MNVFSLKNCEFVSKLFVRTLDFLLAAKRTPWGEPNVQGPSPVSLCRARAWNSFWVFLEMFTNPQMISNFAMDDFSSENLCQICVVCN